MGQTRSKESQENNILSKKTHCKVSSFSYEREESNHTRKRD